MLVLTSQIVLRGPDRGGLAKPAQNGLRPSFSYSGQLVACEVWSQDHGKEQLLPLDEPFLATVRLPYADQLGWRLTAGEPFQLSIASQVIGDGEVK